MLSNTSKGGIQQNYWEKRQTQVVCVCLPLKQNNQLINPLEKLNFSS
jgi:hypothetical protein